MIGADVSVLGPEKAITMMTINSNKNKATPAAKDIKCLLMGSCQKEFYQGFCYRQKKGNNIQRYSLKT